MHTGMHMHTGKLIQKCAVNNFKQWRVSEFLQHQAEQQDEEHVHVVHEEEEQAVQADEEP
ncbi:hypothetical protein A2U01_0064738, partial [Trifolium medium]|nr:hypothetical protein [Trifolium medium]